MSDFQILRAYGRLQSVREVAKLAGVSHVAVWKKLRRAERDLGQPILVNTAMGRKRRYFLADIDVEDE